MKLERRFAVQGAVAGVAMTYPVAALFALLYRFPVPFGGYVSGPPGAALSIVSVTFYGMLFGGFAVQGALGAVAGVIVSSHTSLDDGRQVARSALAGAIASVPGVAVLALLDKIIGPW